MGAIFRLGLKKPSYLPGQSTGLRLSLGRGRSHMGYGATMYGWGKDLEVFYACMRRSSF
jgi:hypothetical protein